RCRYTLCFRLPRPLQYGDGTSSPDAGGYSERGSDMEKMSVAQARQVESVGRPVTLQGWVRTRRDSKGGFSFIEINDGSCFGNVQVVADGKLPNYESEVKKLTTGSSVTVTGEVKASPAKGQATEVHATGITVHGGADADSYPLQKKGHTFEFL